jgi:hypothetical protein
MEDRSSAIVETPKARYDGMRVLELFEQYQRAGTTEVLRVGHLTGEPQCVS